MEKNILHAIFFDEHNHWDNLVHKYGKELMHESDKIIKEYFNKKGIEPKITFFRNINKKYLLSIY